MTQHLTINGVDICQDFHVVCDEKQAYKKPERNVSTALVNGRNGEILTDYKSMKNVEIVYTCVISENFRRNYSALMDYLYSLEGYVEIVDDNDGDCYRQGYFVGNANVDQITQDGGRFSITFNCKPQRFLISGKATIIAKAKSSNTQAYVAQNCEVLTNQEVIDGNAQTGYYGKFHAIYLRMQSYVDAGKNFLQILVPIEKKGDTTIHIKVINSADEYAVMYANYSANDSTVNAFKVEASAYYDTNSDSYFITSQDDSTNRAYYSSGYIWVFIPLMGGDIITLNNDVVYNASAYLHYELNNPTNYDAKPIIKTHNAGVIIINGVIIKGAGEAVIDCEAGVIYSILYGLRRNKAYNVDFMPEFPVLKAGVNHIVYPKANNVEIIPRWWRP